MFLCLLFVFLLTAAYLLFFKLPNFDAAREGEPGFAATTGFVLLCTVAAVLLVALSVLTPGSAATNARRFQYTGVSVAVPAAAGVAAKVYLTGEAMEDGEIRQGFRWYPLPPETQIALWPTEVRGDDVLGYGAEVTGEPGLVRLNGRCVNRPLFGWIAEGDRGGFSVWRRTAVGTGGRVEFWLRTEGNRVRVESPYDKDTEWTVVERWTPLRELLRRTKAAGLNRRLAGLVTPQGLAVQDRLLVVREWSWGARGDGDRNAVGLVELEPIDPDRLMARYGKLEPAKGSPSRNESDSPTAIVQALPLRGSRFSQANEQPVTPRGVGFRLVVEAPGAGRHALQVPARVVRDTSARLDFRFDPARSFPLPKPDVVKAAKGKLHVGSTEFGPVGSGYVLDSGNLAEPSFAVGTFGADGRPLTIGEQKIVPNVEKRLGDSSVAPLYQFRDPLADRGLASLWPLVGPILGAALLLFALRRAAHGEQRYLRAPESLDGFFAAFVVWGVAVALVATRYVISLRTSLLPPDNLDSVDVLSFLGTGSRATAALAGLPIAIAVAILLGLRLAPQRSARWDSTGDQRGSISLVKVAPDPYGYLGHVAYVIAIGMLVGTLLNLWEWALWAEAFILLGVLLRGLGTDESTKDLAGTIQGRLRQSSSNLRERLAERAKGGPNPGDGEAATPRKPKAAWLVTALSSLVRVLGAPRFRLSWALSLLLLADPGSFLFVLPLLIAIAIGARIKRSDVRTGWASRAVVAGLLLVVLGLPFASRLGGWVLGSPVVGGMVSHPVFSRLVDDSRLAFAYRTAAIDAPYTESLLLDPDYDKGTLNAGSVMRTLQQRWRMLGYVKEPRGPFAAPMGEQGMNYGAMLSDAAFSVFLIGEHGRAAGVLYVGLLLLLAAAVFMAAWRAATTPGHGQHMRGLYAIGGVIGFSALYMALGNLWAVPFTGQNMPMLGLNSWQELLLTSSTLLAAGLLCALPTVAAPTAVPVVARSAQPPDGGEREVVRLTAKDARPVGTRDVGKLDTALWWAFPVILVAAFVFFGARLASTSGPADASFDLATTTKDYLKRRLESAQIEARGARASGQDTSAETGLATTPTARGSSRYVRGLFAEYGKPDGKTPFVPRRGVLSEPEFDPRHFLLFSPFRRDEGVRWHGSLLAKGDGAKHLIFVGGSRQPWELDPNSPPDTYRPFDKSASRRRIRAQSINIEADGSYGGPRIDASGKAVFRWGERLKQGRVYVNGKRLDASEQEFPLVPGQIVSFAYPSREGLTRQLTLHYTGKIEPVLAITHWRNGRYRRVFPQGADVPLARSVGEVADETVAAEKLKPAENISLSLDLRLQRRLMEALRAWNPRTRSTSRGIRSPDGTVFTSVAVLETSTGRLLALPSLPQREPSESLTEVKRDFPSEWDATIAASSSWALVNRTIGSAIKPLSLAAIATQLQGSGRDITKLIVHEDAADSTEYDRDTEAMRYAYRQLGDLKLLRGRRIGSDLPAVRGVGMHEYLTRSRTWPAVVSGTIGLVPSADQPAKRNAALTRLFAGPPNGFVSFGDRSVGFRPATALRDLWVRNQSGVADPNMLAETALFRGIEDCYGPNVAPFYLSENRRWGDDLESNFLFPLDLHVAGSVPLRARVLPEPHWADATLTRVMDGQLMQYMFGGGENRWNAVTMAANMARITSGVRVQPTLRADKKPETAAMPAPISSTAWRQANLLSPLLSITTLDNATAVRQAVERHGYRIAMKTGTIDDSQGMDSEMLMFTIGPYTSEKGFDAARSVSGFLSVRSSKPSEGRDYVKGALAERVVKIIADHLAENGAKR